MPPTKAHRLTRWLAEHSPDRIGEAEFAELRAALAPVSESYLRKLVRGTGVPLDPLVEGVRQGSFDELEASLLRLLDEYERGDQTYRAKVRRLVIIAKDHARLAGRRVDRRAEKEEMTLWLRTWLENPPLFPAWVRLRRRIMGHTISSGV